MMTSTLSAPSSAGVVGTGHDDGYVWGLAVRHSDRFRRARHSACNTWLIDGSDDTPVPVRLGFIESLARPRGNITEALYEFWH